jgi:hypothetical protein
VSDAKDSYTAREAAQLIGRSERLVRQLAERGELVVVSRDPLKLQGASVRAARAKRKGKPGPGRPAAEPITPEQLSAVVKDAVISAVAEILPRALESRDRSEQLLRDELARTRAELEQIRQQQQKRRGFFSR